MKKIEAFTPDFDSRKLFHTARAVREAEFDYLMLDIAQHVGSREHLREELGALARNLRGGVYPSSIDAFLKAADYLREHLWVLNGAAADPLEIK